MPYFPHQKAHLKASNLLKAPINPKSYVYEVVRVFECDFGKLKVAIFRTYCKNKITEMKIRPEQMMNMDKVPLTFDISTNRTVEKRGLRTVSGNEKSSFTVVLGCQADG